MVEKGLGFATTCNATAKAASGGGGGEVPPVFLPLFFGEEREGGGVGRLDGLEVEAELSCVAALFSEEAVWME